MDTAPHLIVREFYALSTYLRRAGCSFHDCVALGTAPVSRGVSFRYDVHLRDLSAAHFFLAQHLAENIPATFFLLWDYSPRERKRLPHFRALARKAELPVTLGLHDSPVDTFLIDANFAGDRKAYVAWSRSDEMLEWFAALAGSARERERIDSQVFERFALRVEKTKQIFGPITAVASHGGQIGQALRQHEQTLASDIAALMRGMTARGWLTPERVTAAGLDADVETYRDGRTRQISDGGGKITALAYEMHKALSEGLAVQILLHPYTWDGATRDAELTTLIGECPGLAPNTAKHG